MARQLEPAIPLSGSIFLINSAAAMISGFFRIPMAGLCILVLFSCLGVGPLSVLHAESLDVPYSLESETGDQGRIATLHWEAVPGFTVTIQVPRASKFIEN